MTAVAAEKPTRAEVIESLRWEAQNIFWDEGREVSANDVRPLLAALGYEGDARILGVVFNRAHFLPVGWTRTDAPGNHGRAIRTFRPAVSRD